MSFRHSQKILNVVPGDFRHVGRLDVLVMSQNTGSLDVDMTLYPAPSTTTFSMDANVVLSTFLNLLSDISDAIKVPSSTQSQPIVIDVDGDLKIDLFGESSSRGRGTYQLWQNVWNETEPQSSIFKMCVALMHIRLIALTTSRMDPEFHGTQCKLADPHSNAVVDLDGDCLAGRICAGLGAGSLTDHNADVFLVCDDGRGRRSYQIWVNQKQDGFVLARQGSLPSGAQSISFADIGTFVIPQAYNVAEFLCARSRRHHRYDLSDVFIRFCGWHRGRLLYKCCI